MADFVLKRGSLLPSCTAQFSGGSGRSLSGATVRFLMCLPSSSTPKVNAVATIEDATLRTVRYDWSGTDTDTAGDYRAEWLVTYGDAKTETFPAGGYHLVSILQDLA